MPVPENDKIEKNCPICHEEFKKDDDVYRPLLLTPKGEVRKIYHIDCLTEWCKRYPNRPCIDPLTTIEFKSGTPCKWSQSYRITLRAGNERILLGTEPCDRFYDIREFLSTKHNIPIGSITLKKEGKPVVDSEFIKDNVELELEVSTAHVDDMSLGELFDDDKNKKIKMGKLVNELTKLESLQEKDHLSNEQITEAAKQVVLEHGDDSSLPSLPSLTSLEETEGNITQIDAQIREIDRTLSTLSPTDPKRAELDLKYKELLIKGILVLYEKVKDYISGFLSGTINFATDPEIHDQILQFISYVYRLSATGLYNMFYYSWYLTSVLGWGIVKLIPKIINYVRSIKKGEDPEPDEPVGVSGSGVRIRKRDAAIVQTWREAGVAEEDMPYGYRKGEEYKPGLMFTPRYI